MRRQTARLTHGIWQYRRAHETNWYFVRPCTLYNTFYWIRAFSLFRYVSSIFFFIIVASAFPLIFGLRAESGLSNERTRWFDQFFCPRRKKQNLYFIVPWMLSILLCIRWWSQNVCHDVVVAWLRLPYSFISTCSLPEFATHTYWQLAVLWELLSFLLYLPFIYLLSPLAFLFCFTILWRWVTLFDIHAPFPSSSSSSH